MIFALGRLLQFVGLVVLPVAIAGNASRQLDLRQMLTLSGFGIAIFVLGWLLQQAVRGK